MIHVLEWSKGKPYGKLIGKFQCIQILSIDPLLNPTDIPIEEIPRNLIGLDMNLNMDFKENSPYQDGVMSDVIEDLIGTTRIG